jgi:hypothetical protein
MFKFAPRTSFELNLTLKEKGSIRTLAILRYLLDNISSEKGVPKGLEVPPHPFFNIPDWQRIFRYSKGDLTPDHDTESVLFKVSGRAEIDEQDIGLLLNWLSPFIQKQKNVLNTQLAVVNYEGRPNNTALVYTLRSGRINVNYTDKPFMAIQRFTEAA